MIVSCRHRKWDRGPEGIGAVVGNQSERFILKFRSPHVAMHSATLFRFRQLSPLVLFDFHLRNLLSSLTFVTLLYYAIQLIAVVTPYSPVDFSFRSPAYICSIKHTLGSSNAPHGGASGDSFMFTTLHQSHKLVQWPKYY